MCLNPPIPPPTDRAYLKKDYPQVTLIVAPAALLDQWKDEIITHCKKNEFSVFIHHGQNRVKTAKELWKMDVVICTYHAIMNSFPSIPKDLKRKMTKKGEQENWLEDHKHLQGPFHKVKFWR